MGNPRFCSKPPVARQLVSGLAPCPCGGSDLVGIVKHLGRCLACAKKDLDVLDGLVKSIREAIELADTKSAKHRAVFDPDGVGEIPAGWRVAEKMREVLVDSVSVPCSVF